MDIYEACITVEYSASVIATYSYGTPVLIFALYTTLFSSHFHPFAGSMPAFVAASFHRRALRRRAVSARATKCCLERQRHYARVVKQADVARARLELAASRRRLAALRELRKDVDERRRLRLAARAPIWTLALALTMTSLHVLATLCPPLRIWLTLNASVGGVKTLAWEPWRLLAAAWVHKTTAHLVHNAVVLGALGCAVEMVFGAPAFGALFTGGAIGGAVLGALARPARLNVSVGMSGALHGMAGSLLVHLRLNRKALGKRAAGTTLCALIAGIGVALSAACKAKGVDVAAHFGGLISGMFVGALLAPKVTRVGNVARVKRAGWRRSIFVGVGVYAVGIAVIVARLWWGV